MLTFPFKVATWNVNGLRARAAQLSDWLDAEQPDIVCLQEIRVTLEQVPPQLWARHGYHCHWHGGGKGYSGVALLVSERMGRWTELSSPSFDFESRVVGAEVGGCRFYSVYVPNGGKDLQAKIRFWEAMDAHLDDLARAGKSVILGGDLNIARTPMDVHPKEAKQNCVGQLPQEREMFERLLSRGYVDLQRSLHPDDADLYSWWAPWRNLRDRNIGWRIDYLLASEDLAGRAVSCVSQREVGTSDHGPVVAVLA